MKTLKAFLFIAFLAGCSDNVHAATCKLKTDGYGSFIGTGATESVAFENAAEKCFDSLSYLKAKKSKKAADEDQQISFVDYCVNLSCS